jgi:hypothetical protein
MSGRREAAGVRGVTAAVVAGGVGAIHDARATSLHGTDRISPVASWSTTLRPGSYSTIWPRITAPECSHSTCSGDDPTDPVEAASEAEAAAEAGGGVDGALDEDDGVTVGCGRWAWPAPASSRGSIAATIATELAGVRQAMDLRRTCLRVWRNRFLFRAWHRA